MASLREEVRHALPANVLALMDEIEAYAELAINVDINPKAIPASTIDANPLAPAAEISHDRATIYLREANTDAQGILHELLHIHRFWVERIPQIQPVGQNDNQWSVTASIENALEHLVIVPREADFGFDPYPYWNEIERVLWAAYPWPSITLPFARRKHCLLGWLTTELVNDPEVKELVRAGVAREGLFVEAEKFRRRIGALLGNKERTVACAVRFLKIPRDQARLVYFDVRARKRTVEVIPDH
jgi:hypothetical protein